MSDSSGTDAESDAPPVVVGAVAAGVAPVPFLAVYAILFIARGTVRPVIPPDIGSSKTDELLAGLVALVLFVAYCLAVYWLLDGRRRWPFVATQALTLGSCVYFLVDSTSGAPGVPVLLVLTSLAALVLAALPATWQHVRGTVPAWLPRRSGTPDGA